MLQTASAQAELQSQKEQASRLRDELSAAQRSYEDKCGELTSLLRKYTDRSSELEETRVQLQAERLNKR